MPERDIDARRLFGTDTGVTATAFLALLGWLMGEAVYARRLIDQAIREGDQTEHVATIATNHLFLSRLEVTEIIRPRRCRPLKRFSRSPEHTTLRSTRSTARFSQPGRTVVLQIRKLA